MAKLGEYADKLETITAQEVVEVGLTHLLEQGVRSDTTLISGTVSCVYRGPNGICCGAGPFLRWDEDCEGMGWEELVDECKATKTHASIICDLQKLHDAVPVSNWSRKAKEYFSDFDLDFLSKFE